MQLLSIRKATPAVTHAKSDSKVTRPRNKKQNMYSPSAAGKTSRQLPPSWPHNCQMELLGPRPTLPLLGRYPSMEVQRPAEKNNIKKTQQKAAWHASEPL